MARSSPDHGSRSWTLAAGAVATGLGMGLAATSEFVPGLAICLAGCLLLGGTWVFGRKAKHGVAEAPRTDMRGEAVDPETDLPCQPQLTELLRREMARSRRYGDRTALAIFDVRVTGAASHDGTVLPSPAKHIAASLLESAREADIVARLGPTQFVVMLTESDGDGAAQFAERARTRLGTTPFTRLDDGHGVYVRAWAGWARWEPAFESPERYLDAAIAALEHTRPGYEAQQSWFRGAQAES